MTLSAFRKAFAKVKLNFRRDYSPFCHIFVILFDFYADFDLILSYSEAIMTQLSKNPIHRFIEKNRKRLENLQEASFDRGEKQLIELMGQSASDIRKDQFPVPTFFLEILVWAFIILFPIVLFSAPSGQLEFSITARSLAFYYLPLVSTILIFGINQRLLVPKCFFKKKYLSYFAWNGCLLFITLVCREAVHFAFEADAEKSFSYFISEYCFSTIRGHFSLLTPITFVVIEALVCTCCIVFNIFSRQIIRAFIIREKSRSTLQYELDFLKNQLSPHFLFNTLNNITALIQIDPKRAEKSMNKLSQLLRVTLYQTSDELIPISEDIDILQKYAELEQLRLDSSYDLSFDIKIEDPNFKIAPLIGMPLVENAIKHSINPSGKSFAHISIVQNGDQISFSTENSNFPRKSGPKSGGLGLSTLKKRLELQYNGKYSWKTEIKDGTHFCQLVLTK